METHKVWTIPKGKGGCSRPALLGVGVLTDLVTALPAKLSAPLFLFLKYATHDVLEQHDDTRRPTGSTRSDRSHGFPHPVPFGKNRNHQGSLQPEPDLSGLLR